MSQLLKRPKASPFRGTHSLVAVAGIVSIVSGAFIWEMSAGAAVMSVQPVIETQTFAGSGDIADDSAIWANPIDPSQSLVVAGNKADSGGGLGVFDLTGKMVSYKSEGKIGNVDLRSNFMLGGQPITIVGANRRDNSSLVFYKLDPASQSLTSINARTITTMSDNYGMCLYKSATATYANVMSQSGSFQQWELVESSGKVDAKLVRTFAIGSISEGCVADDALGHLYINQEDVGVWKYSAESTGGSTRTSIAKVGDGNVVADVEGIAIAYGPNGTGHIIVSSQGNDTFAVYDRVSNAFVKKFSVVDNGSIDGAQHTDGIDVTTANLGGAFSEGMLVVHDEFNTGSSTSNLKYVPLSQVFGDGSTVSPSATPTPTVTSGSATLTYAPAADAKLRSDAPSTNYGSSSTLEVDASPAARSLMKFSVTGIAPGATVTSVKLRLYTTNASVHGGNLHRVADTSWSEGSVNWSNGPAADASPLASLPAVSANNWVEVTVPGLITQNGTYTLSLQGVNSDGADYSSKEATSNRPALVITTTSDSTATVTPTPTPTQAATPTPTPAPSPTVSAGATNLTFNPIADAKVRSDAPSRNYGTVNTLEVDSSPAARSFMKFNITGIGSGTVSSVKLRLFNTNASPHGGNFHRVADTSWGENTINWSNAPAADPSPLASYQAVTKGKWAEITLPVFITQDGTYTVSLEGVNSDGADYRSREYSGYRPVLTVTVNP